MHLELMLQVNDNQGNKTNRITGLELSHGDILMTFETVPGEEGEPFKLLEDNRLQIAGLVVSYHAYKDYAGTITWDVAEIKAATAAKLVNALRETRFVLTGAALRLLKKWQAGEEIGVYDFEHLDEPYRSEEEWQEMLERWRLGLPKLAAQVGDRRAAVLPRRSGAITSER